MLKRPAIQLLLLTLVPVTSLGVATYANWSDGAGRTVASLLASLGAASGIVALVFAFDAARMRRAFAHLRAGRAALGYEPPQRQRMRERRHHETVSRLRRQVELLSAIRDLALIANDDVRFEHILERCLGVLRGLLDAREITIYLLEGAEDELVPVAHLLGEKVRVRGERALTVAPREAADALEAQRTVVDAKRGGMRAATLLVADGAVKGALEVRLAAHAREREPVELVQELEGLAKHIALAVSKPTLYDQAVVDGLTGLYTKRHFQEQVVQHMAQRTRLGTPLSLIILDVDHFKQVNDVHGHVAGDLVLAEVARRVKGEIRAYDQAFRYGGEEVIILAPNTPLEDAVNLAERLRKKLRTRAVDAGETAIAITASFGVAEFRPEVMEDPASFVEEADGHLYRAKRGGRDQVQSALTTPAEDDLAPEAPDEAAPALAPISVEI